MCQSYANIRESKSYHGPYSSMARVASKTAMLNFPCNVFTFTPHQADHFIRRLRSNDFTLLILLIKQTDAQSTAQGGTYARNIPHILRLIIEWI